MIWLSYMNPRLRAHSASYKLYLYIYKGKNIFGENCPTHLRYVWDLPICSSGSAITLHGHACELITSSKITHSFVRPPSLLWQHFNLVCPPGSLYLMLIRDPVRDPFDFTMIVGHGVEIPISELSPDLTCTIWPSEVGHDHLQRVLWLIASRTAETEDSTCFSA